LRVSFLFFLLFVLLLFPSATGFAQDREYQIKAEFLERFTRFIEWPADSSVSDPSSPFTVCVIGENPYGTYLQDLAAVERIHKKQIEVSDISSVAQIPSCNLLFISKSEKGALTSILNLTSEKPILTVGDSPGFADRGVLINFYEDLGYVRFEINPGAVRRSGLKFSSRLLKLGRLIKTDSNTGSKNANR
jgi:hypothetical protein